MKRLAAALLLVSLFVIGCEETKPKPKPQPTGTTAKAPDTTPAPVALPQRNPSRTTIPAGRILDYKKWSRMRRLVASIAADIWDQIANAVGVEDGSLVRLHAADVFLAVDLKGARPVVRIYRPLRGSSVVAEKIRVTSGTNSRCASSSSSIARIPTA